MKIALTKSESKFHRYEDWLKNFGIEYEVLDFESYDSDLTKLDDCGGLILTGGIDIYPELYCDWDTVETKGTYTPERDGFELKVIENAIALRLPVLAICRGMQLMNVKFRGSLIFDLEEIRNVNHRKISKAEDRIHEVRIFENTLLHDIVKRGTAVVNSSHHQSIDRLGEGLMVSAKAGDGIVEGIEYSDKTDKPFFIGIQWHPERFADFKDAASKNILERFISECK